ncbi:hypothetical protein RsTz2092_03730 [Deferribacterales bacterium RsTz2092]|nr:hypothetical protein AGMMS49941_02470 [Deferribacterales bacterium]
MSYIALARKYRPSTFDELIGQEDTTTSLKNAIRDGKVSHAYLFTGARGVGKTSAARILAKALNCLNPQGSNPCNECEHCREITDGAAIDVLEIDGASNRGIDEIRELNETVKFFPVKYRWKIVIVDEVHMLTKEASNALLKTLEEPPEYVKFIFATTDAHKVLPTVLSRCQKYDFQRIPFEKLTAALVKIFVSEHIEYEEDAVKRIALNSEGCFRDALSFSDQMIAYSGGKLSTAVVDEVLGTSTNPLINGLYAAVISEDTAQLDEFITKICGMGISLQFATERMIKYTRDLLLLVQGAASVYKELTADEQTFYKSLSSNVSVERLYALFQLLQNLYGSVRYSTYSRYAFEFGMFKAASLSRIVPLPVVNVAQGMAQPAPPVATKKPMLNDTATTSTAPTSEKKNLADARERIEQFKADMLGRTEVQQLIKLFDIDVEREVKVVEREH